MSKIFKDVIDELDKKLIKINEEIGKINMDSTLSEYGREKKIEPLEAMKKELDEATKDEIRSILKRYEPKNEYKKMIPDVYSEISNKMSIAKLSGVAIDDSLMQKVLYDLKEYDFTPIAEIMDINKYPLAFKKEKDFVEVLNQYKEFELWLEENLKQSLVVNSFIKEDLRTREAFNNIKF